MDLPRRKINRLKEYDYSKDGAYFITICIQNRADILSKIIDINNVDCNVGGGFPVPSTTILINSTNVNPSQMKQRDDGFFVSHIIDSDIVEVFVPYEPLHTSLKPTNIVLRLTQYGEIVEEHIKLMSTKYPCVHIDKYVIMPNHIHMIVSISSIAVEMDNAMGNQNESGTGNPPPTVHTVTIGTVMGWFKYQTIKCINEIDNSAGKRVWQRSFHDHIIKNEKMHIKVWNYIDTNLINWTNDKFYYHAPGPAPTYGELI